MDKLGGFMGMTKGLNQEKKLEVLEKIGVKLKDDPQKEEKLKVMRIILGIKE